jgi:sulfur carrier protein ThiS
MAPNGDAPAGADADVAPPVQAGRIRITLKLFASLTKFFPDAYRKSREMPLEIDADATIESIIAPLGMPPALVKLVLLNGIFVPPEERAATRFIDGDALAIWPPSPCAIWDENDDRRAPSPASLPSAPSPAVRERGDPARGAGWVRAISSIGYASRFHRRGNISG